MEIQRLAPLERLAPLSPSAAQQPTVANGFSLALNQVLGGATRADLEASQAVQALADGEADDLHTVALALTQADLSFRLALEMRNRLQEGLQEILRLTV
jgi:flagellar hook-basal body complex protein FliE